MQPSPNDPPQNTPPGDPPAPPAAPNPPATPPAPAPPATPPPAPAPAAPPSGSGEGGDDDGDSNDVAKLKATLAKVRAEAREAPKLATQVKELQAKIDEQERAKLSDTEKTAADLKTAQAKIEELQAENRSRVIRFAIAGAARDQGFADPDDAFNFLTPKLAGVKVGADGEPEGIKELVEELAKAKPYLIKPADGAPQNREGPPPSEHVNGNPRGLTPEEDRKLRDAHLIQTARGF